MSSILAFGLENSIHWASLKLYTFSFYNLAPRYAILLSLNHAFLSSAAIGADGIAVGHCVRASVRPSVGACVCPSRSMFRISVSTWKFGRMMHSTMRRSLFKMTILGQFLPEASFGFRVLSLPACVRVSVNHELVCAITRHKFELESPNLDQKMQNILLEVPIVLGTDLA